MSGQGRRGEGGGGREGVVIWNSFRDLSHFPSLHKIEYLRRKLMTFHDLFLSFIVHIQASEGESTVGGK